MTQLQLKMNFPAKFNQNEELSSSSNILLLHIVLHETDVSDGLLSKQNSVSVVKQINCVL